MSTWSGATNVLYDELSADTESRRRLRSASSTSLDVRRTRLSTVGDSISCCSHSSVEQSSITRHCCPLSIFCCRLNPCPHCRRKVRLSPKTARQRRNSATVALLCDSVDRLLNRISSHFLIPLFSLSSNLYSACAVTRHFGH